MLLRGGAAGMQTLVAEGWSRGVSRWVEGTRREGREGNIVIEGG